MDILDIIEKKKNGLKLSKEEIQFFIRGVCDGSIRDFQTTSFLMAICLKGIDFEETFNLTMCMAQSGEMLNLDDVGDCVDKHSTGGVSDTTTLVVVPTLASLGVKVAKMSGRSLGFTGGTADKMEVFQGYQTEISTQEFKNLIKKNGASIVSPSANFALADKIIYKLRSESGTVEDISLIASSIMSKKLASGTKIIIIDCKYGNGAFMKTLEDSKALAKLMVEIGKKAGVKVCAVISSMDQPLTEYVGNNLEVYSSIKVLNGEENNLFELSSFISAKALVLASQAKDFEIAQEMAKKAIKSGIAKQKLKEIVLAQGGKIDVIDNPELLLPKNNKFEIYASKSGFVEHIDTSKLGKISHDLQKVNGQIVRQDDVGLILNVKLGDYVKCGDAICKCFYNQLDDINEIKIMLENCFAFGDKKIETKLIEGVIE